MEADQIEKLDRRNREEQAKLNMKLDSIERALRGTNGDPGLVGDVREIKKDMGVMTGIVDALHICIHGDPKNKDDKGIKEEQRVIQADVEKIKKDYEKNENQRVWINRAVIGAAIGILADTLIRLLQLP